MRTRIGSIFGIGQVGVGPLSVALWGGQAAPSPPRKCAPRTHLDQFLISFGIFWVFGVLLDFCPIVGPIVGPIWSKCTVWLKRVIGATPPSCDWCEMDAEEV